MFMQKLIAKLMLQLKQYSYDYGEVEIFFHIIFQN